MQLCIKKNSRYLHYFLKLKNQPRKYCSIKVKKAMLYQLSDKFAAMFERKMFK